ncbi:hypothetical protein C8Q77DRAFT_484077 [Trametes polyzona]|nr:hypothetical protein C8Q77DRAFT_484077 [Trametes polyzona]
MVVIAGTVAVRVPVLARMFLGRPLTCLDTRGQTQTVQGGLSAHTAHRSARLADTHSRVRRGCTSGEQSADIMVRPAIHHSLCPNPTVSARRGVARVFGRMSARRENDTGARLSHRACIQSTREGHGNGQVACGTVHRRGTRSHTCAVETRDSRYQDSMQGTARRCGQEPGPRSYAVPGDDTLGTQPATPHGDAGALCTTGETYLVRAFES